MQSLNITLVSGSPGAGKTTWIQQQIHSAAETAVAVMSCIHGNYEALNAVLSDIDDQNADKIYCLGDLVGYGPHPNAVVEMIRALDIPTC